MSRFFTPERQVAHERVEDEVIAINLLTGTYFSLRESAADAWTLLTLGADVDGVSSALASAYSVELAVVAADIHAYVATLLDHGLLIEDPVSAPVHVALPASASTYRAPSVESFDDMEELLLLDPIHEVDDAGWPVLPVEPR